MKIEHLAIWTKDLERMKLFYEKYFEATAGKKYYNPKNNFESCFLQFDGGARLELMRKSETSMRVSDVDQGYIGLAHFAMAVGSKEKVNSMTEQLRNDGYKIIGEPRTTGDGYYESVVIDPEGNRIEITV